MPFLASEQIGVDARLPRHIVVYRQAGNLILKRLGVQALVFKVYVESAPIHAFHWPAVLRENGFHPVDYRLEVTPQGGCGLVVLMRGHVLLDRLALVLDPLDRGFEVLLALRPPVHKPAADCISRASGPFRLKCRFASNTHGPA